ncbi:MAG: UvrD-helicase domain-containing protein [Bacilli bacterium]|nr:UvrD-helicase domain-containing protein [Bacilli bacterium]
MAWTKEQELAINTEGKNIIVSAGAGSGKTAVLTARVLRKLTQGIHINELLILTFTNAAAAEMKNRIREEIMNNKELIEEANLLDSAYITTFDSYSLSLVKKYHTKLNITNKINITEASTIDMIKRDILDEIFEENYLSPKKGFMNLINDFCLKNDKDLRTYLLNAYKKLELKYDKSLYLENYMSEEFTDSKIDGFINEYIDLLKEKQTNIKELLKDLVNYFEDDFIIKVEDSLKELLKAKTYDDFVRLDIKTVTAPRGSDKIGQKVKANIYGLASDIKKLCVFDSEKDIKEEILSTKDNLKVVVNILKEFDKRLETYKLENEIFGYSDISRLAIKLVKDYPDIREEVTNSFNEILVDEYQDTSDIQELFISLISKDNTYMVGDIKQSIYRFRNANPYIFKNKYDTYSNNPDLGIKIDLLKNFRSREEVLNNINMLFDLFMDDKLGGANYKVGHQMVFGNTLYSGEGKTDQNYNLEVLTYDDKNLKDITSDEQEAFMIASDIKNKIDSNFQIFDKKIKTLRKANYNDFVILIDKSKNFTLFKKVFEYLNIPLSILKDESFKEAEDATALRNLLRLLICIKEDKIDSEFKYAFTSVSRSFLWKTNDDEIYNYFINDNFKDSDLYKKCLELVKDIDNMNLSSYFLYLIDSFDYDEKLITLGNIKSFRTRSEYFYNLCRSYENLGKTIYDFVEYLNELFDNDYDLSFDTNTVSNNSCKIMTIHKSKGLEFSICYYAGLSSNFNTDELKDRILFDNKYGIILPKVDNYYKDTVLKVLLKDTAKKEDISERIRLFYVALTRAKEKMVIVMPKQEDEEIVDGLVSLYTREKYNSFLSVMKSIYSVLLPYVKECNIIGTKDYLDIKKSNKELVNIKDNLVVTELSIESNILEEKHYSKDKLHLVEPREKDLLEFGTKVHEILEEIDFNNYNLDNYNVDDSIKEKINSFVNSDFMKDKLVSKMYKEYEFLYHDNNVLSHGIIDLLIEQDDKMIIIDYKLKNIDDENYDIQLNGYRKYIENKTNKKVECYLYSIINENYREVKDQ